MMQIISERTICALSGRRSSTNGPAYLPSPAFRSASAIAVLAGAGTGFD
jgi:hypothetical protein